MTKITVPIFKAFKTIGDVQNECNFIELVLPGKLISLKAVGEAAEHKTEGVYDRMTSEEFLKNKNNLGKLTFKLDNDGTNTTWINGVRIKVSFS